MYPRSFAVLIDPNQRVIYDRCGAKGLEVEGMEVSEKKTEIVKCN